MNKKLKTIIPIIIGLITAFLGAYGGAENTSKAWRRIGISVTMTVVGLIALSNIWTVTIFSMLLPLSQGYGLPTGGDKGSFFGRIAWKLSKGKEWLANILCRGFLGIWEWLSLVVVPILKHNWLVYGIVGAVYLAWKILWTAFVPNEGEWKIFGVKLGVEELLVWLSMGVCGSIAILF